MDQHPVSVYGVVRAAAVAAVYVVLTLAFAPFSFGPMQVRIAEALTILPMFTPAAVPGLFVGCLLANILGGAAAPDIVFGSLATLIGAVGSRMLRNHRWLVPVPPIAANTLIIPFVLKYGYGVDMPVLLSAAYIAAGEIIGCGVLGEVLASALMKHRNLFEDHGTRTGNTGGNN